MVAVAEGNVDAVDAGDVANNEIRAALAWARAAIAGVTELNGQPERLQR